MLENIFILKPITLVNEFLELYNGGYEPDLQNILNLNFKFHLDNHSEKISPIVHLAKPEEAEEVTLLFNEIYEGSYPYKQMEDKEEIRKMILNPSDHWFIFKINSNETVGCFGVHMEFENKRGLLYGFIIKKEYHKVIDIFKTFVACIFYLWKVYKDKILVWYAEIRTNDTGSQYVASTCGLKPIAILPNKDIFFNRIETDVMHIIYLEKALTNFRNGKNPKIIRQILDCYAYSNERFHLGTPQVENPKIVIDSKKLEEIRSKLYRKTEKDRYNNQLITFSIRKSKSYFKFLYNPLIHMIEKTEYNVENLEELVIFLDFLKKLIIKQKVRYLQCSVSAYNTRYQKVFYNAGFNPVGYIFSWFYNKESKKFEDRIIFCYHEGSIDLNIKLIPESVKLLKFVNNLQ